MHTFSSKQKYQRGPREKLKCALKKNGDIIVTSYEIASEHIFSALVLSI